MAVLNDEDLVRETVSQLEAFWNEYKEQAGLTSGLSSLVKPVSTDRPTLRISQVVQNQFFDIICGASAFPLSVPRASNMPI